MSTNNTNNKKTKLIHPELSYLITGICFDVHNKLGRFAREKQYADEIENCLRDKKIKYVRENEGSNGNRHDFIIEGKIILELKAKPYILKADYNQTQRYLQMTRKELCLLVNFRSRYLKPSRIVRIDTSAKNRFV